MKYILFLFCFPVSSSNKMTVTQQGLVSTSITEELPSEYIFFVPSINNAASCIEYLKECIKLCTEKIQVSFSYPIMSLTYSNSFLVIINYNLYICYCDWQVASQESIPAGERQWERKDHIAIFSLVRDSHIVFEILIGLV